MLNQDLSVEDRSAEWLISEAGYKNFLKWEKIFRKYPLSSVPPHIAASHMARVDAQLAVESDSVS
jgi:hypothetical protein